MQDTCSLLSLCSQCVIHDDNFAKAAAFFTIFFAKTQWWDQAHSPSPLKLLLLMI